MRVHPVKSSERQLSKRQGHVIHTLAVKGGQPSVPDSVRIHKFSQAVEHTETETLHHESCLSPCAVTLSSAQSGSYHIKLTTKNASHIADDNGQASVSDP